MSSLLVQRDDDDKEALIGWWREGDGLGPDTMVVCGMDEVALLLDDEDVIAELGPGRHRLTPEERPDLADYLGDDPPDVDVAFIRMTSLTLGANGTVGDCTDEATKRDFDITLTASLRAKVVDPAQVLSLNDQLEDDVTVEDFLIETVLDAATDALVELGATYESLTASGGNVDGWVEATRSRVATELSGSGIEIELPEAFVAELEEPDPDAEDD